MYVIAMYRLVVMNFRFFISFDGTGVNVSFVILLYDILIWLLQF